MGLRSVRIQRCAVGMGGTQHTWSSNGLLGCEGEVTRRSQLCASIHQEIKLYRNPQNSTTLEIYIPPLGTFPKPP
jgi:hypothetical protein